MVGIHSLLNAWCLGSTICLSSNRTLLSTEQEPSTGESRITFVWNATAWWGDVSSLERLFHCSIERFSAKDRAVSSETQVDDRRLVWAARVVWKEPNCIELLTLVSC